MSMIVSKPGVEEVIASSVRLQRLLWKGRFGLETERLRVDRSGRLALTPHPAALGDKARHPYVTTDFSESQLELITPPLDSLEESHGFLNTILSVVREGLPADELLWPQSMPAILPEKDEDIPLARFDGESDGGRTAYRERLAGIYGRARQTISGSHFNFSFAPAFITELSEALGEPEALVEERVYLKLLRALMRERWFLVGVLGRSPVAHESLRLKAFDSEELLEICCACGVSIRCSRIGYRNRHPFETDYCCLRRYAADLAEWVRQGKLISAHELYQPIRLKMRPDGVAISHLEFRFMDLDPFEDTGVSLDALRLLHLFAVYSLTQEEPDSFGVEQQARAQALQDEVACCGLGGMSDCDRSDFPDSGLQRSALEAFDRIEAWIGDGASAVPQGYAEALARFRGYIEDFDSHPANVLKRGIQEKGFIAFHLQRAREQEEALAREAYRFHGLADLELSTQLLLKAAVRRGVEFEILDRRSNFVRLRKSGKEELVVQATKTSLDRYSQVLAMENKQVTKFLLRERGIATPEGGAFGSSAEAKAAWEAFRGQPAVVKPATTNFGIGITMLKKNDEQAAFEEAVDHAFAEDGQVLIESFVEGREYRFFLIDGEVVAVLHRVPANVLGDGRGSIGELVEEKNRDPRRGEGYRTPLERIRIGTTEERHLRSQGLDPASVPAAGERVFLRENSNISTGGDSIDWTDRVHPSYARIAEAAARALRVNIVGLDLIARDIEAPATSENHAIIELNFNPAIHIHCHPFEGRNRKLDERILDALGFE